MSRRAMTQRQLMEKLQKKEFSPEAVEYAVTRLVQLRLLDDAQYAQNAVRSLQNRGYGALRIQYELRRRGVDKETAEEALQDFQTDEDLVHRLLEKKLHGECEDRNALKKAADSLCRKGYTWEEVRLAIERYRAGCNGV